MITVDINALPEEIKQKAKEYAKSIEHNYADTREELEKEAEEKYSEVDREFIDCQDEGEVFNIGYILGAEPRKSNCKKRTIRLQNLKHRLKARKMSLSISPTVSRKRLQNLKHR